MNELVCGSTGTGKTTYIRGIVDSRIDHNEHTMVLTNEICKRIYWKNESDLLFPVSNTDKGFNITEDNNTPSTFASYILNLYIANGHGGKGRCLVVDEFNFDTVNPDYRLEAFYDAIAELFKTQEIGTIFTYNCVDVKKELAFDVVPKRMVREADRITVLK